MYVLKIVIIKLRLNKGVTVMSEEKHVVEHEQQKKEKTKAIQAILDCHEFYNTYSCTITPGTFKSADNG